jgi:hypothetical protein
VEGKKETKRDREKNGERTAVRTLDLVKNVFFRILKRVEARRREFLVVLAEPVRGVARDVSVLWADILGLRLL